MNKTFLTGLIALIVGVGLGIASMLLFAQPAPPQAAMNHGSERADAPEPEAKTPEPAIATTTPALPEKLATKPTTQVKPAHSNEELLQAPIMRAPAADIARDLAERGFKEVEGTISGVVRFEDGTPAAGVTIQARPQFSDLDPEHEVHFTPRQDGAPPEFLRRDTLSTNPAYILQGATSNAYSREVVTNSAGRYEVTGLIDSTYYLAAYRKGYNLKGNSVSYRVAPGTELDFTATKIRSIMVTVLNPDGSEAKEAIVSVSQLGGYRSVSNGNYHWTPETRDIPHTRGIFSLYAQSLDSAFKSAKTNVNALTNDQPLTVTLKLEAQTRLEVIVEHQQDIENPAGARVYAADASLPRMDERELQSKAISLGERDGIHSRETLDAGNYTLYLLWHQNIVATTSCVVGTGVVTKITMTVPAPKRADYVVVFIDGVSDAERGSAQISTGYRGKSGSSGGGGAALRQKDGSIWIQHRLPSDPNAEVVTNYVSVTVHGRGTKEVDYARSAASEVRVTFGPVCLLELQVVGFDINDPSHRDARIAIVPQTKADENDLARTHRMLAMSRSQIAIGQQIDARGMLYLTGFDAGEYDIMLFLGRPSDDGSSISQAVRIVEGTSQATLTMPVLYSLRVRVPDDPNTNYYSLGALYQDGKRIQRNAWNGDDRIIEFGQRPAGEYEIRMSSRDGEKIMKFVLSSDAVIDFVPTE